MREFLLPDLGEGLVDAVVVEWAVEVGQEVAVDHVVVTVETQKATVELPVPFAGTITALLAPVGERVAVGQALLTMQEDVPGLSPSTTERVTAEPGAADHAVLVGYGVNGTRKSASLGRVRVVSPRVREMARSAGLDLRSVVGTGPDGLVRRVDVERALEQGRREHSQPTEIIRTPLTGARAAATERAVRSRRDIPEATVWVDFDASELDRVRTAHNAEHPDQAITIAGLLAYFVIVALGRYPELNSRVEHGEILRFPDVHLGVAVQGRAGLTVPVVRRAQSMNAVELCGAIATLAERARSGSLRAADLTGSTITVNNYGVYGVDGSASIINHPEAVIVGVGRVVDRPWVVDGALGIRKVGELTLAFDHRVCDGATAGPFLRMVADGLESACISATTAAPADYDAGTVRD